MSTGTRRCGTVLAEKLTYKLRLAKGETKSSRVALDWNDFITYVNVTDNDRESVVQDGKSVLPLISSA